MQKQSQNARTSTNTCACQEQAQVIHCAAPLGPHTVRMHRPRVGMSFPGDSPPSRARPWGGALCPSQRTPMSPRRRAPPRQKLPRARRPSAGCQSGRAAGWSCTAQHLRYGCTVRHLQHGCWRSLSPGNTKEICILTMTQYNSLRAHKRQHALSKPRLRLAGCGPIYNL